MAVCSKTSTRMLPPPAPKCAATRRPARIGPQSIPRPTSTSRATAPLVKKADAALLLAHGRIEDEQWAELWTRSLSATLQRAQSLQASENAGQVMVDGGLMLPRS